MVKLTSLLNWLKNSNLSGNPGIFAACCRVGYRFSNMSRHDSMNLLTLNSRRLTDCVNVKDAIHPDVNRIATLVKYQEFFYDSQLRE